MQNKKHLFALLLLVTTIFTLSACSTDKKEATAEPIEEQAPAELTEPTAVVEQEPAMEEPAATEAAVAQESPTEEPVSEAPSPTMMPEAPSPTVTMTPIPEIVDVDSACINCHTDVDQLKELAVEPEVESLSSGEG